MKPYLKEVNTTGFRAMCEGLAQFSGKSFSEVIIDQVGALLKVCMRLTPAASAENIVKRVSRANNHIEFSSGHTISLWKKADSIMFLDDSTWNKKGKAPAMTNGKTWHDMTHRHWSDERWARYQAYDRQANELRKDPKEAKKARGLSKQSWLQIAQDLGLTLDAPAYVTNARPSNGKTYKNGVARKFLEVAAAYIEITNDNPIVVRKLDGWGVLNRALSIRRRAFEIDCAKGVFSDIATRAKRYPGIFTA